MNHDATREISNTDFAENPTIRQKTAAPYPMDNRGITQKHPQPRKQQDKTKADAFHVRPDDKSRCDDRECHLERKKQNLGQGACKAVNAHPV